MGLDSTNGTFLCSPNLVATAKMRTVDPSFGWQQGPMEFNVGLLFGTAHLAFALYIDDTRFVLVPMVFECSSSIFDWIYSARTLVRPDGCSHACAASPLPALSSSRVLGFDRKLDGGIAATTC